MFQLLLILQRGYGLCLPVKILEFIKDIIRRPCVVLFMTVQRLLLPEVAIFYRHILQHGFWIKVWLNWLFEECRLCGLDVDKHSTCVFILQLTDEYWNHVDLATLSINVVLVVCSIDVVECFDEILCFDSFNQLWWQLYIFCLLMNLHMYVI